MPACILFCAAEYLKANPATHLAYGAQWSSSTQWNCFNCKDNFLKMAGTVVLVSATLSKGSLEGGEGGELAGDLRAGGRE